MTFLREVQDRYQMKQSEYDRCYDCQKEIKVLLPNGEISLCEMCMYNRIKDRDHGEGR